MTETTATEMSTKQKDLITAEPTEIRFGDGDAAPKTITVTNVGPEPVAFQVRFNHSEGYSSRPSKGIIKPVHKEKICVQLAGEHRCLDRDELLLEYMEVEKHFTKQDEIEDWLHDVNKADRLRQLRIPVHPESESSELALTSDPHNRTDDGLVTQAAANRPERKRGLRTDNSPRSSRNRHSSSINASDESPTGFPLRVRNSSTQMEDRKKEELKELLFRNRLMIAGMVLTLAVLILLALVFWFAASTRSPYGQAVHPLLGPLVDKGIRAQKLYLRGWS